MEENQKPLEAVGATWRGKIRSTGGRRSEKAGPTEEAAPKREAKRRGQTLNCMLDHRVQQDGKGW